jgi:CubicO group peptidase (beta-lactamase class C family)
LLLRTGKIVSFGFALSASAQCSSAQQSDPAVRNMQQFDERMESLRRASNIPAISVAIVADQHITWSKGYGTADLATGRLASDTTTYHFASLTKPFAAAILLQLVDEGKITLDDPVADYGIALNGPGVIRIRHLLSHTSIGTPGTVYRYDGNRFGLLDAVITRATGTSFAVELQRRLLQPLSLTRAAPNPDHASFDVTGLDRSTYRANIAQGYSYRDGAHEHALPHSLQHRGRHDGLRSRPGRLLHGARSRSRATGVDAAARVRTDRHGRGRHPALRTGLVFYALSGRAHCLALRLLDCELITDHQGAEPRTHVHRAR